MNSNYFKLCYPKNVVILYVNCVIVSLFICTAMKHKTREVKYNPRELNFQIFHYKLVKVESLIYFLFI